MRRLATPTLAKAEGHRLEVGLERRQVRGRHARKELASGPIGQKIVYRIALLRRHVTEHWQRKTQQQ
jgi:hypothetical protein